MTSSSGFDSPGFSPFFSGRIVSSSSICLVPAGNQARSRVVEAGCVRPIRNSAASRRGYRGRRSDVPEASEELVSPAPREDRGDGHQQYAQVKEGRHFLDVLAL